MFPDGQNSNREAEHEEGNVPGSILDPAMVPGTPEREEGKRTCRDDGSERDVSGDEENNEEKKNQNQGGEGHQGQQNPEGCGDPFPSLETQPGRIIVPKNGEESGDDVNHLHKELSRFRERRPHRIEKGKVRDGLAVAKLQKIDGQNNRDESLENVENQTNDARPHAENPKDVSGSNIAGTMFADVDSFDHATDNETKGSRRDDEGEDGKRVGHEGEASSRERKEKAGL